MRAVLAGWSIAVALLLVPAVADAGPKDDLLAADKAFSDMSVAKGSDAAFLSHLADDGHLFGTGSEPPIYGKAEAAKRFAKRGEANPSASRLSWSPEHAALSGDGTMGWTDGAWIFVGPPDAKGVRAKIDGHYLTVWKKDLDGKWKVAADMGTVDKAPAAAP